MKPGFQIYASDELLAERKAGWKSHQWAAWIRLKMHMWAQKEYQGKCTFNEKTLKNVALWPEKAPKTEWKSVLSFFKIIGKWIVDPELVSQLGKMEGKADEQKIKADLRWAYDELNRPGTSAERKIELEKQISALKSRLKPGKKPRKSKVPAEKSVKTDSSAPKKEETPSISAQGHIYPADFEQSIMADPNRRIRIFRTSLEFIRDVIEPALAKAKASDPLNSAIDKKACISYAENVLAAIKSELAAPKEVPGGKVPRQILFERKMYYPNDLAKKLKSFAPWELLEKLRKEQVFGGLFFNEYNKQIQSNLQKQTELPQLNADESGQGTPKTVSKENDGGAGEKINWDGELSALRKTLLDLRNPPEGQKTILVRGKKTVFTRTALTILDEALKNCKRLLAAATKKSLFARYAEVDELQNDFASILQADEQKRKEKSHATVNA